mmetsp:Transcript_3424/g.5279  ORF Transcript_3424/g.5279 Transcript_3424/m.5279 type:complete len:121 (-) Transcript_3424:1121-1483(-)
MSAAPHFHPLSRAMGVRLLGNRVLLPGSVGRRRCGANGMATVPLHVRSVRNSDGAGRGAVEPELGAHLLGLLHHGQSLLPRVRARLRLHLRHREDHPLLTSSSAPHLHWGVSDSAGRGGV